MQPDKLEEDQTGTINKTPASVLEGKHPNEKKSCCDTLQTYDKTPIFIPVDITEDAVKLVAQKRLGTSGLGGMDSEALQGWLIKFGEDIKRLSNNVGTLVDWLSNGIPP